MRAAIGLLLLLFQLQPLAGVALCLHSSLRSRAECAMPGDSRGSDAISTPAAARMPGDCVLATVCAPSTPTIPAIAGRFVAADEMHPLTTSQVPQLTPGDPPDPLPHPPRA